MASQEEAYRRVADFVNGGEAFLVTSGGTTVPLDASGVRKIDNFSTGRRGARLTELIVGRGVKGVLLRRNGSAAPFCEELWDEDVYRQLDELASWHQRRRRQEFDSGKLMELLFETVSNLSALCFPRNVEVPSPHPCGLQEMNLCLNEAELSPCAQVWEYFALLEGACKALRDSCKGRQGIVLAAAVSDFYVPENRMPQGKLRPQAGEDEVQVSLAKVPNCLRDLVAHWCNEAFVVAFKLVTREESLDKEAASLLNRTGVHAVIGNYIDDRRHNVCVFQPDRDPLRLHSHLSEVDDSIVEFLLPSTANPSTE